MRAHPKRGDQTPVDDRSRRPTRRWQTTARPSAAKWVWAGGRSRRDPALTTRRRCLDACRLRAHRTTPMGDLLSGERGDLAKRNVRGKVAQVVRPVRRAWPGVGSAGGLPRRDRGAGEGGPVGDQDRGAAGAPRRRGPVPDAAPVLRGAVQRPGAPPPRCGPPTGNPGWSASSTSATWACWPTQCPGPGAARRHTRPDCASKADLEGGGHGPYTPAARAGSANRMGLPYGLRAAVATGVPALRAERYPARFVPITRQSLPLRSRRRGDVGHDRAVLLRVYEQAIFAAMKAVKVRLRKLGDYSNDIIGIDLMTRAAAQMDGATCTAGVAVERHENVSRNDTTMSVELGA